jgi:hypothetical protein
MKVGRCGNFAGLTLLIDTGMEKLQKSMTVYVKSISKRTEEDSREKLLPVGYMGATMISHGQDFQHDSEFGNCLISTYLAKLAVGHY